MSVTWDTESLPILRGMVGDLDDATPLYSDERLMKLLIIAAFQVNQEASFPIVYNVSITEQTITPDPANGDSLNNNFINLMTLKAACIMDRGIAGLAAGNAIAGRDMNAVQFDLRGVADSTLKLLKEGWCTVYKEVLYDYISGNGNLGAAVLGPFRTMRRWW